MKITYNNFEPLGEKEIAGQRTINPMQRYMLGIHSLSEFITINPDGMGSISLDMDYASLASSILGLLGDSGGINFDFRCDVNGSTLTVEAGTVFLPFSQVSIAKFTHTLVSGDNGKMIYARLSSTTTGEIVLSNGVTHTLQTGNQDYRTTLPIATVTNNNGWAVKYHHIGAFTLTETPYFYVSGYSKGSTQTLDHDANTDGGKWVSYGDCNA